MIVKSIRKESLYFVLFVFLMMIASVTESLMFIALGILIALFVYINLNKVKSNSIIIPKIVVSLLLFQNLSIGIGARLGNNFSDDLSWVTQVPTIFIVVSYFIIIMNNKIRKREFLFFGYIILNLMFFFIGSGTITARVVYLRNFLIFYMVFEIGRYYLNSGSKIKQFVDFFLKITVMAVIFGLIGFILGKTFYQLIGVLEVYKAKQYTAYRDGLPGNFMTLFGGVWVNRFVSLYYDPVNFSYFMSLACLIAYTSNKKFFFIIFLICEILTFGKGGLLVFGLAMMCMISQSLLNKYSIKIVRIFIISMAIISIVILVRVVLTYFSDDFGTYNHFYGIVTGIEAIKQNPLGHGFN
ncbi:MAG: hypothetical protein Q4D95_06785 [Peptoniphilus sp.]|nr:hypothetical protein [Peptoniphilus sp.]